MNITITFRQMTASEAMKSYATEKVGKLQKFLRQAMSAHLTMAVDGKQHVVEVNISSGGAHFQAHERSGDMHASIDAVVDKLERQICAAKDASVAKTRGGESTREFAEARASSPGEVSRA